MCVCAVYFSKKGIESEIGKVCLLRILLYYSPFFFYIIWGLFHLKNRETLFPRVATKIKLEIIVIKVPYMTAGNKISIEAPLETTYLLCDGGFRSINFNIFSGHFAIQISPGLGGPCQFRATRLINSSTFFLTKNSKPLQALDSLTNIPCAYTKLFHFAIKSAQTSCVHFPHPFRTNQET